jgi:hypothetical protein
MTRLRITYAEQLARRLDQLEGIAPIYGAPFTVRTLHAPDGRRGEHSGEDRANSLDKLVTVTLALVRFGNPDEVATVRVDL